MSNLILPMRYAQMARPVVFWYSAKLDNIFLPASTIQPCPTSYVRIECRHAYEVEMWSNRLRAQEKRLFEMTDLERFEYEEKMDLFIIEEMERNRDASTDATNKQFMQWHIDKAKDKRAARRPPKPPENHMACEASDGVAS